MKQTATEWLFNKLLETPKDKFEWYAILDKAKEMEKKEYGEIWDAALDQYDKRGGNYIRAWEDFDEYYNETYEK